MINSTAIIQHQLVHAQQPISQPMAKPVIYELPVFKQEEPYILEQKQQIFSEPNPNINYNPPYEQNYSQSDEVHPYHHRKTTAPTQLEETFYLNEKVKLGFQKLEAKNTIFIRQKAQWIEAIGPVLANHYMVYGAENNEDKTGKLLFRAKEKSRILARICLPANCRPYTMQVYNKDDNEIVDEEPIFFYENKFQCTILCFNRPELKVMYYENNETRYLGKIRQPWMCMNLEMQIYDAHDILKYRIFGTCCQLGLYLQWPCEACQTIDFNIYDIKNEKVGSLRKVTAGCLRAIATNATNFIVKFPEKATKEDKALFLAAAIMIDFSYFERRASKNFKNLIGAHQFPKDLLFLTLSINTSIEKQIIDHF